jgi:hypothetical protein
MFRRTLKFLGFIFIYFLKKITRVVQFFGFKKNCWIRVLEKIGTQEHSLVSI